MEVDVADRGFAKPAEQHGEEHGVGVEVGAAGRRGRRTDHLLVDVEGGGEEVAAVGAEGDEEVEEEEVGATGAGKDLME